jgi:hypothetical protein
MITHQLSATTPDDPAYEIRPSHWNQEHVQALTLDGNTAGQSTWSGTNLVLQGGPNATLSLNGNTLVFSGGVGAAGNTGYLSADGNTASLGTVVFSNSNGIGFGIAGQTLTASHNGLTTAAQSNHSHGNPTLNLTNLSGTTNSNSAGLTLSLSAAAPFVAGVSTGGNTAGDTGVTGTRVVLVGSNTITWSQTTGAAGATITVLGANTHDQQTGISGIVASDATYTSGTVSFSNQNGVTIGSSVNGATQYVRLSVATSYAASDHSHGNPTLALTNLSGTTASNSAGLTLSLSAAAPGGGGNFSAGATPAIRRATPASRARGSCSPGPTTSRSRKRPTLTVARSRFRARTPTRSRRELAASSHLTRPTRAA